MDNVSRFFSWLGGRFIGKSEPEVKPDAAGHPAGH
jgi:hypothetical protein